ncbi:tyrosine--tRNA ligase [Roseivirga pacifica]|uniref:tyrosine--tRNA ligase n=1 Tax=Roseivirga pacifica TaxID=1267423 RepID=UPI002095CB40|nr:tyrosine--tRNA ligase [Roseivirga pacifica]MCO6360764.1 tyrosine--tRNA ligase [Roseivirga pacifica]MCO6368653.1 tyrosine--tRNA ligase [Roseivirga pacifica]MCO6372796.1 tyrosine--tRNA ligase [Roseivirga pacifica]MCO6376855.1 tyrosine--tRNA ligase [Roseivirga pacifica]MCO6377867.1 tyrosine--tRNA ligase [Roseivirga pacifica]
MSNPLVEELKWRGMVHDMMPGTEEQLSKEVTTGYVGFDPTADSLHIGNLVPVMLLVHLQRAGHKPVALVGGATGMVGDPSGKSAERPMLDLDKLNHNLNSQKKQLQKFLNFDCGENSAEIVNNYDWFKDISFLDFIRDTGKHITVNYMMSKDSVKNRLETGMSFTEFTYQLVQGYDFYHLYNEKNCRLQMGGSDQWGNIVTGTELIRRKVQGEAFALTAPLIKKADGSKFGKSEGGNVWLDAEKTSPYKFYQYWLNTSDEDASNFIRIFTLLSKEEIEALEKEHNEAPHLRVLQKALAEDITIRVHSKADLDTAIKASNLLFGKSTTEDLESIDEKTLLAVFEGVPQVDITTSELAEAEGYIDLLSTTTKEVIFKSKGEARRMLQGGGVSINKAKIEDMNAKPEIKLLQDKYFLVQKGKKNYYLITVK